MRASATEWRYRATEGTRREGNLPGDDAVWAGKAYPGRRRVLYKLLNQ